MVRYVLIILLQFGGILYSQTVYFNNRYHYTEPDVWGSFNTIVNANNGYMAAGATGDTSSFYWNRIGIVKLDTLGNIIVKKIYGDTISTYFTGFPGCLKRSSGGNYYLAGAKQYYSPNTYNTCYIIKTNENCDTLWSKEINANLTQPADSSIGFYNMNICSNGDLIFTGGLYYGEQPSKILLMRTDSMGNVKLVKYFGTTGLNTGYSIAETIDNGIVIGGYWYVPGSSVYTGDPIVIKTDCFGNWQWSKNLGGVYKDNKAMVQVDKDGNIIVGTMYGVTQSGSDPESKINIIKLSNEGNIIWNKKYGVTKIFNYLLNLKCLEDGRIVATGTIRNQSPYSVGWLLMIDTNGDSLWYRKYENLHGEDSWNELKDIIHLNDNGFVACGLLEPFSPDTGTHDGWVIKLDSLGCDTPGCDPGVWIPKRIHGTKHLRVFPNPANNNLNITLIGKNNKRLLIYDIFGRKQEEINIPEYKEQLKLNVSSYKSGMYIGVLKEGKETLGNCKFMVRH